MSHIMDFQKSKSFCPYPWIHGSCTVTGSYKICCLASDEKNPYIFGKDSLSEIWNSDYMKDIRSKMLNDEEVQQCKRCMYDEKVGKDSQRINAFERWKNNETLKKNVEHSMNHDGKVKYMPISYDLRLGNLCNLKCRMCFPNISSQVEKENNILHENNVTNDQEMFPYGNHDTGYDWYCSEEFWNEFIMNSTHMERFKAAGGEPLINSSFYKFIDYFVYTGLSENMSLDINTNITTVPQKFLDTVQKFKDVKLLISIDGTGIVNEYIRYPSKWKKIHENFDKLYNLSLNVNNLSITIIIVVQVYNIFNILDLLKWLYEEYINENPTYCHIHMSFVNGKSKRFLDINILPDNMKEKICADLQAAHSQSIGDERIKKHITAIINHIKTLPEDREKMLSDFVKYTNILDQSRNQNIRDYIPELVPIMDNY